MRRQIRAVTVYLYKKAKTDIPGFRMSVFAIKMGCQLNDSHLQKNNYKKLRTPLNPRIDFTEIILTYASSSEGAFPFIQQWHNALFVGKYS